jgi:hypothetical protein
MIFRIFTFGVAAAIGMTMAVWTADREPPIVIATVDIETPEVQPGGELLLHYYVKRYRECSYSADRVIFDSMKVRYVLPDQSFIRPPGPLGDDDYRTRIKLPDSMSQGAALYKLTLRYECNIIHKWWPIISKPTDVTFVVKGPRIESSP